MPDLPVPHSGDPFRAVLLAVGPGLVAGTVSSLLFGYGVEAPNVFLEAVFTYASLLLWSLPALPLMALALVRWVPRGRRLKLRGPFPALTFVVASLWHLIVAEVVSWVLSSESFVFGVWERIAAAYIPAVCCTVAAWMLYVCGRRHDSR